MRWTQPGSSEPVMPHEPDGIPILHDGIFARDPLIDGHQHLLLTKQLENGAQGPALSLNQLFDTQRVGYVAREVSFSIGRLQLSH